MIDRRTRLVTQAFIPKMVHILDEHFYLPRCLTFLYPLAVLLCLCDLITSQSFAEYRLTQLERATNIREKTGGTFPIPDDSTLKRQFDEQAKAGAAFSRWNSIKSIVTSIIMIVLAVILFSIHWRWLRGLARSETRDA